MSNSIDKLFNEKLNDHALTPPPRAWARVQASLSKKNDGTPVYRIAATLLLFAVTGLAIVWLKSREIHNNSAQITQVTDQHPTTVPKTRAAREKATEKRAQLRASETLTPRRPTSAAAVIAPETVTAIIQRNLAVAEVLVEKQPALTGHEPTTVTGKTERPIVLEYTLETIPTEKPIETSTLPMDTKEKKRLQKVLDFALDAKNSEGAVSGLRQAKDEFFAFNFRKDKQKNSK